MPQLGETVTEGTITRWLKHVGDRVEADEPLFEVSTDKVDSEVPAPAAGTLTEILVQEGETAEVGVRLAVISDAAGAAPAPAEPAAAAEAPPRREPEPRQPEPEAP
ncbi:MAG: 2-oxoglutarate dehydrogenase, E2 component, dihydrolipoamide succinyltransferase, partial [Actinomycetota bacterium]|nr:2-oxoglutarate dehydrogenase, E2 component, dihydrolipoamide succinyltransferase [Actinomycetota bacterium]